MNELIPLLKHNPPRQDPAILEAITVQREGLISRLVETALETGQAPQHQLLVGPRGMGKTHILSLVASRVREDPRGAEVVVAWLPEDPWKVRTYDKLLAAVVSALGTTLGDPDLRRKGEELHPGAGTTGEEAEETLRAALGGRRLLLLTENLDEIFRKIGSEAQSRFRAFADEWGQLMVVATSPQLFKGITEENAPFHDFFSVAFLEELTVDSALELMKRIATLNDDRDLLKYLDEGQARKRVAAIEALAGGHPRIWLLLAGCISVEAIDDLVPLFIETIDELTPYYQSHLRELGDQQQELVVLLSEAGGALSNRQLAERSGISQNQIATMLRQLTDRGYVRPATVPEGLVGSTGDKRLSFWELREPLMRICLDVKQSQGEPLRTVVEFLRAWYGSDLLDELARLPEEAKLATAYASEAIRAMGGELTYDDLVRGSPGEVVARVELGLALLPERFDLQVAHVVGLLGDDRNQEALEELAELRAVAKSDVSQAALHVIEAVARHELGESIDVGDVGASLANLREAAAGDPDNLQAIGSAFSLFELDDEALATYTEILDLEPDNVEVHGRLGVALWTVGRTEEAMAAFAKAIELDPTRASIYEQRALAFHGRGRFEEALRDFVKAAELEPESSQKRLNCGVALLSLKRPDEALEVFTEVATVDPDEPAARMLRGEALRFLERPEESLSAFDEALELDRSAARAWSGRGVVLSELKRHEEALASFRKAVELDPASPAWKANEARSLRDLGRIEEAAEAARVVLTLDPDNADRHWELGLMLQLQGRSEEALRAYDQASERGPESANVQNSRANALRDLGRLEEAERAARRAVELDPGTSVFRFTLAEVILSSGDFPGSIAALGDALTFGGGAPKRGDPGEPDLLCRILWEKVRDGSRLGDALPSIVSTYGEWRAADKLAGGVVNSIPLFVDDSVGQREAEAWVGEWAHIEAPEMEIPLKMLRVALAWKRDRDRAHLLELPLEQREILVDLLAAR